MDSKQDRQTKFDAEMITAGFELDFLVKTIGTDRSDDTGAHTVARIMERLDEYDKSRLLLSAIFALAKIRRTSS